MKVEVEALDSDTSDPNMDILIWGPTTTTETVAVTDDANYEVFRAIAAGTFTATQVNATEVGMQHK